MALEAVSTWVRLAGTGQLSGTMHPGWGFGVGNEFLKPGRQNRCPGFRNSFPTHFRCLWILPWGESGDTKCPETEFFHWEWKLNREYHYCALNSVFLDTQIVNHVVLFSFCCSNVHIFQQCAGGDIIRISFGKKLPGPFHWCCFDSQHFLMSFVWHRTFCETCCEFQKEDKTSWKYSVRWVFINKESSKSCVLKHIAPWITVKEHCWIHWGCRVRTSVHFHTASHRNCQLSGTMSSGDAFLKSD